MFLAKQLPYLPKEYTQYLGSQGISSAQIQTILDREPIRWFFHPSLGTASTWTSTQAANRSDKFQRTQIPGLYSSNLKRIPGIPDIDTFPIGIDICSAFTSLVFSSLSSPFSKPRLEICSAPGTKLSYSSMFPNRGLFGIDKSEMRLRRAKNIVDSYKIQNITEFVGDATSETIFTKDSQDLPRFLFTSNIDQKKIQFPLNANFSSILIDAECSVDASVNAVKLKFFAHEMPFFKKGHKLHGGKLAPQLPPEAVNLINSDYHNQLAENQYHFLVNASRLNSDYIIYSTCTFSTAQNIGPINKFLENNPNFHLVDLSDLPELDQNVVQFMKDGYSIESEHIPSETVQLYSGRTGVFLAVLKRRHKGK